MFTLRSAFLTLSLALAFSATSVAADKDAFTKACQDDIQKHCGGVAPGGGRIGRCLHDKKEKVSSACRQELTKVILETFQKACGEDARKHCGKVAPGGGRILACLKSHRAALSASCQDLVDKSGG